MTATGYIAAVVLLSGSSLSAPVLRNRVTAEIQVADLTYAALMAHEPKSRAEIFCSLSAENQAQIMATHMTRWRDRNSSRLTQLQLALLEEWLALVKPSFFTQPQLEDVVRRREDLDIRSAVAFSADDIAAVLTLDGPYLPPQ